MADLKNYVALLQQDADGFGVMFPDFPGCVSAGRSFEDALANAAEALAFHVAGQREDGLPIPAPRSLQRIRADREDWIDWEGAAAALVPLIEPSGKAKPANVTFDSALLAAIDRYAKKKHTTRSAVLADGAVLMMATRPAPGGSKAVVKAVRARAKTIKKSRADAGHYTRRLAAKG